MTGRPPGTDGRASPGLPLPRSGSEFGANLLRNQPGRALDRSSGGDGRRGEPAPRPAPGAPADGAGSAGGPGREHRDRYLLPSSEAFDLDLHAIPPVLGAPADEEQDR